VQGRAVTAPCDTSLQRVSIENNSLIEHNNKVFNNPQPSELASWIKGEQVSVCCTSSIFSHKKEKKNLGAYGT
jgi:hypothetical protein